MEEEVNTGHVQVNLALPDLRPGPTSVGPRRDDGLNLRRGRCGFKKIKETEKKREKESNM